MIYTDRKNCEGTSDKPVDMAYNATSFVWNPEMGAKVSWLEHQYQFRVGNCIVCAIYVIESTLLSICLL